MWMILISMGVIVVLAALVVVYVAFPHRGQELPAAPWLGDALRKGVEAAPTLDNTAEQSDVVPGLETREPVGTADAPESRPRLD